MSAIDNYQRCVNDPWFFLSNAVYTKNQIASGSPTQKFPSDWPYLRLYAKLWEKNKLIAVPKSRRMTMSWTNIALYLWAAMFQPGRDFAFVSKKEDDSAELVKRAEFIYDHIPEDFIPRSLLPQKATRAKPPALIFPEIDSKIQGFPMGADQLRQFTFSGILGDECAFWEEAQRFYTSAIPTIEGGGRMTLISSRSPGYFQRIVYDRLDDTGPIDENITPQKHYPLGDDSVVVWKNPKNKFLVIDVHYTANPGKRDPEFKKTVKASMSVADFMVEYERNWSVFEGQPVFQDYVPARHETREPIEPHLGLPLLCGVDFGLTPAMVVAQLREGRLFIIREYVETNMGIERFLNKVMPDLRTRYPQWRDMKNDFRFYIDPAGLGRSQTDERTCAGVMAEKGLKNIFPGPIDWESRRKAVEHFLITQTKEGPALQLYPKDSPTLARSLGGAYHFPDSYSEREPNKISPVKDHYSHCFPAGTMIETKRGPVPIERVDIGDEVLSPGGYFPVTATMNRFADDLLQISFDDEKTLTCTPDHPIFSSGRFVRADALKYGDDVTCSEDDCLKLLKAFAGPSTPFRNSTAFAFTENLRDITRPLVQLVTNTCIGAFGSITTAPSRMAHIFITLMGTGRITTYQTYAPCRHQNTCHTTDRQKHPISSKSFGSSWMPRGSMRPNGTARRRGVNGTWLTLGGLPTVFQWSIARALTVARNILSRRVPGSADSVGRIASLPPDESQELITNLGAAQYAERIGQLTNTKKLKRVAAVVRISCGVRVFDLTVKTSHCFFANGVLVHNCADALQYLCSGALQLSNKRGAINIPIPEYGFTKSNEPKQTSGEYTMNKNDFQGGIRG